MKKLLLSVLCIATTFTLQAQEKKEEFKITGKPIVTIFANYAAGIGKSNSLSGFNLDRAYLGYSANISEEWSAKVVLDIGSTKVSGSDLERVAYVKNAQMTWKRKNFSLDFGLISLQQFGYQEKFWGYRYIAKSFQDEYKFGSSADLGITAAYKFAPWVSADFSITNGEGYKKLNTDNKNRYGIGVTIEPIKGFSLRGYYDIYSKDVEGEGTKNQNTASIFAGYKNSLLSIGAEYNTLINNKFKEDRNQSGYSIYATVNVCKKVSVFARYDNLASKEDWNISSDGANIIAGAQYVVNKYFKISPNFQSWSAKEGKSKNFIFLNLEFKL